MHSFYDQNRAKLQEIGGIKFTHREVDLLSCVLHGRGSKKIAELLSISPKTAEAHIRNIMLKLDCNSRESIIDFIEKSSELQTLHHHYFSLIKSRLFLKKLAELSRHHKNTEKICGFVYDPRNPNQSSFFKHLEHLLHLAGLKSEHIDIQDLPPSTNASQDIFTVCDAAFYKTDMSWKPNQILLLPQEDTQFTAESPSQEYNLPCADFRTEALAYSSFFHLLQSLIPSLDVEACLESVRIKTNEISPSSFSHEPEPQPSQDPPPSTQPFWKKSPKLTAAALVGFVLLGSTLTFTGAMSWLFNGSNTPIRSNLLVPNHATLLERPSLLNNIAEKLKNDPSNIRVVAVVGIGGSGKSTLAKAFGRNYKTNVVWEINAQTPSSIARSFETLASALAQNLSEKQELEAIKDLKDSPVRDIQLLSFVKQHLRNQQTWLLIYDNLENFGEVHDYFPHDIKSWGPGRVLITTQNENLKNNSYLGKDNIITVGELNENEKMNLFHQIIGDDQAQLLAEETKDFLERIPPFPLDVSVCAYYLKNSEISPESYLSYMESSSEQLSASQKRLLTDISDYTKTRYGIITLSVEKLLQTHPEFEDLLLFISLLGNENIPTEPLSRIEDEMTVSDFLYNMKDYSLIIPDSSSPNSFSIHESTQKILLSYLEKKNALKKNSQTLKNIGSHFVTYLQDVGDELDPLKLRTLIPHAEKFQSHSKFLPPLLQGQLSGQLGRIYYYLGNSELARPHLHQSARILETHYGKSHPQVAWVNTYLGKVYRNLGNYTKAQEHLKRSCRIYESLSEQIPLKYAWIAAHLGNINRSLGNFHEGEQLLRKSLAIYRKNLGDDHIKTAWVSVHLASILRCRGRYQEAYELIKASIPLFQEKYGERHALTAWVHSCLGRVLIDLGDWDEAQRILETNLATYIKYYGQDHIQTAWLLRGLGRLQMAKGHFEEAKEYALQSLQTLEKRDHPDAYLSLELLAKIEMAAHKNEKSLPPQAGEYLEKAVHIVEAHFPASSPNKERLLNELQGTEEG